MNMVSNLPSGKITSVMVAGAVALLFVMLFQHYAPEALRLSAELASAIPWVAALIAGYFTKPNGRDVAKVVDSEESKV